MMCDSIRKKTEWKTQKKPMLSTTNSLAHKTPNFPTFPTQNYGFLPKTNLPRFKDYIIIFRNKHYNMKTTIT